MVRGFAHGVSLYPYLTQPELWIDRMDRATFAAITAELLLTKGIKTQLTEKEIDAQNMRHST